MNKLSLLALFALSGLVFTGCSQYARYDRVDLEGVPEWVMNGARLSAEPEPMRPDPAMLEYEDEGGPVELMIITDKRRYEEPKPRKKEAPSLSDPLERGREYRIKRLFR